MSLRSGRESFGYRAHRAIENRCPCARHGRAGRGYGIAAERRCGSLLPPVATDYRKKDVKTLCARRRFVRCFRATESRSCRGHLDWRSCDGHDRVSADGPSRSHAHGRARVTEGGGAALHLVGSSCNLAGGSEWLLYDDRPDLWGRFRSTEFWWMHAMVRLWLIFTTILFLGEPLVARRQKHQPVPADPGRRLARMQWLHWALLALSSITVLAAVAGSQGICIPISTATGTFRSSLQWRLGGEL